MALTLALPPDASGGPKLIILRNHQGIFRSPPSGAFGVAEVISLTENVSVNTSELDHNTNELVDVVVARDAVLRVMFNRVSVAPYEVAIHDRPLINFDFRNSHKKHLRRPEW